VGGAKLGMFDDQICGCAYLLPGCVTVCSVSYLLPNIILLISNKRFVFPVLFCRRIGALLVGMKL
jgi:hypothetical protein